MWNILTAPRVCLGGAAAGAGTLSRVLVLWNLDRMSPTIKPAPRICDAFVLPHRSLTMRNYEGGKSLEAAPALGMWRETGSRLTVVLVFSAQSNAAR